MTVQANSSGATHRAAERSEVESLLAAASSSTVLVIGDVMLDEYILGSVSRTSPEAPVPVLEVQETRSGLGGAGNVARQIAALGATAVLIGRIGDDEAGRDVQRACESAGIEASDVVIDPSVPTTRKQRVVAGRQQLVRIDHEDPKPSDRQVTASLVEAVGIRARQAAAIIVSDYAKGVVTDTLLEAVFETASSVGIPVLVDPKSPDLARYRGATLIKANQAEFEAAVGAPLGDPVEALGGRGDEVRTASGAEHLVVTLGSRGLVVVGEDAAVVATTPSDDVYDVSGAGDTVISVLALGMIAGASVPASARLANIAAGVVVRRAGVAVVTPRDMRHQVTSPARSVLVGDAELEAMAVEWRSQGRTVVFTNGCFDLLHPGHVHMIRSSAALGDVLVVGVNTDRSVRGLKGPDRPVVGEVERASMVGSLSEVDAVVLFDDPDPGRLIELLGPDVLVKGADYSPDQIVGADAVLAGGGRVETVPLLEGWSTSATVDRIRGR